MIGVMNKYERNMPSSELLRTFLAVVECENVTHAASELGRTQSAISVQLRKLEDTIGLRLFERQARGMRLTEDGRKLLPAARRVISELQRVGTLFAEPLRGRIRVGLPDDYCDTVLERALVDFKQRHPGVEVSARSGCTSGFGDAIRRNELDVAVCSGATVEAGERISSEPTIWAASSTFCVDLDAPVPLAILDRNCWWRDIPSNALDSVGVKWKVAYSSESFASIKSAIRAGLAIGVLPQSVLETSMAMLTEVDGFPPLEPSQRAILLGTEAPRELAAAMANAIRGAIN